MKKFAIALAGILTFTFSIAFADNCCKAEGKNFCAPAKSASKDPTAQDVVIDPVCGMDVKASEAKYKYEYKGKTYYFCNDGCKAEFTANPGQFLKPAEAKPAGHD